MIPAALNLTAIGFDLGNAQICAQACADSYLGDSSPAGDLHIEDAATDTHVLVRDLGNALIVAFRGSASLRNWLTDFDAMKKAIQGCHVHAGFLEAFDSVVLALQDTITASGRKVVFLTGHSLGGALAAIAGVEFQSNYFPVGSAVIFHSVYTFGQPRVGDAAFAQDAWKCSEAIRHFRVTNGADIVPWVPGWLMGYRHFGQHIHFDALGQHLNPVPGAELLMNGLEMYRDFRAGGQLAALRDHAIARYQEALS